MKYGVPQGSIVGPLLYTVFTNELPEVIHRSNPGCEKVTGAQANMNTIENCSKCGMVVCYADDTTYTCSSPDPEEVSETLAVQYKELSDFLSSNKLKLNSEKTQIMVMSTS